MVLALIIGDFHIPTRAHQIPPKFKALLVPGKIHYVLCTGNLCSKETYDYLKTIASEVHVVRGEFDEGSGAAGASQHPETKVVTVEKFRIGLCHGHQVVPWGDREALGILQRQLDCDILVTGHTHRYESFELNGKFFVNPGSATGAYSPITQDPVPSFLLMDIQGEHVSCYLYRLVDGEVRVDKSDFVRQSQQ